MLRGIYTSATGMIMNQYKMDVIANNLANVDKTAFKGEDAIFKSFPEMLIRRTRDDGLGWVPIGSFDLAPVVGKLGTGVELNEIFTRFETGPVKKTDNPFDLMIDDRSNSTPSFFVVLTDRGEKLTRSGSFILDKDGYLVTPDGFPLMGEKGPIKVSRWNWVVKENGEIWINKKYGNDPNVGTNETQNQWEEPVLLDRIKIRTVEFPRELKKEGNSFYAITPESGPMLELKEDKFPLILQGYLEASNVNIVREMTKMIEVQREYEANQKSVTTHDSLLGKLINEVAR
ncbi:MAG: flagellar hook-basal body protein [Leptospiraceae bacterium]|jgi:flagellar basal-body rod protein FlgG|nr:flagellar hook-basal body protein [Leptospiraceae bacterium]